MLEHLLYVGVCTCQCYPQFILCQFACTHLTVSVLYVCVSIPTLQIGSSVPFF